MRIAIRSQGLSKRRGTSACHEAVGLDFIALANQANRWHCQSKFYTACSRTRAGGSSTVFAHESPMRSVGFDAENRLYLFALTVTKTEFCRKAERCSSRDDG
jgi:hypothetical protein